MAMAEHLGDEYFLFAPPEQGALLQVTGNDGISTQWAMTIQRAQALMEPLRLDQRIIRVLPSRYDRTDKPGV